MRATALIPAPRRGYVVTMPALSPRHRDLLDSWLGPWQLIRDCSWPLQDTTVLHVSSAVHGELIIKASATSHHLAREIAAHRDHLGALAGLAPALLYASVEDRILATRYLPGQLVEGSAAEWQPDTYFQAGALLARLQVALATSNDYVAGLRTRAAELLARAELLVAPPLLASVVAELERCPTESIALCLTHGDFQPRNWLIHDGRVALIDFGRAAARPWTSDLVRLKHRQLLDRPDLEQALFAGLDRELAPADLRSYRLEELYQGLCTVVWAHGVGDLGFCEEGRWMLERAIARRYPRDELVDAY
jgi:hypothetical protein